MAWLVRLVILGITLQSVANEKLPSRSNVRRSKKEILSPHKPNGLEIQVSTSFINGKQNPSQIATDSLIPKSVRFPSNPNTYLLSSTVGYHHKVSTPRSSSQGFEATDTSDVLEISTENDNEDSIGFKHSFNSYKSSPSYSTISNQQDQNSVFKDVVQTMGSFFRAIQTFPNFIFATEDVRQHPINPVMGSNDDPETQYKPSIYSNGMNSDDVPASHNEKYPSISEEPGHGGSSSQEWNPTWSTLGDVRTFKPIHMCINIIYRNFS